MLERVHTTIATLGIDYLDLHFEAVSYQEHGMELNPRVFVSFEVKNFFI